LKSSAEEKRFHIFKNEGRFYLKLLPEFIKFCSLFTIINFFLYDADGTQLFYQIFTHSRHCLVISMDQLLELGHTTHYAIGVFMKCFYAIFIKIQ